MNDMCNLSEMWERRGMEKGIEQERKAIVMAMLRDGYPIENILRIANITEQTLQEWREEILNVGVPLEHSLEI